MRESQRKGIQPGIEPRTFWYLVRTSYHLSHWAAWWQTSVRLLVCSLFTFSKLSYDALRNTLLYFWLNSNITSSRNNDKVMNKIAHKLRGFFSSKVERSLRPFLDAWAVITWCKIIILFILCLLNWCLILYQWVILIKMSYVEDLQDNYYNFINYYW